MRFYSERRGLIGLFISLIMLAAMALEGVPTLAMASGGRIVEQSRNANPVWRHIILMANVVTNAGREWVIDNLDAQVSTTGDYIGWGTGAGTAAVGDTILFTEDSGGSPAYARVSATRSNPSAYVLRWVGTLTSNGTKTITNAGNFTASTSGTLICKGDHTGTALNVDDSIQYTIELSVS